MALSLNGNFSTLADFGLLNAAKPVLARQRDVQRKRKARAVASALKAAQANLDAQVQAHQDFLANRREIVKSSLVIVCANGRTIRPIK